MNQLAVVLPVSLEFGPYNVTYYESYCNIFGRNRAHSGGNIAKEPLRVKREERLNIADSEGYTSEILSLSQRGPFLRAIASQRRFSSNEPIWQEDADEVDVVKPLRKGIERRVSWVSLTAELTANHLTPIRCSNPYQAASAV